MRSNLKYKEPVELAEEAPPMMEVAVAQRLESGDVVRFTRRVILKAASPWSSAYRA